MSCYSLIKCWLIIYSVRDVPCTESKDKKMNLVSSLLSMNRSYRIQDGRLTCSKTQPQNLGVSGQFHPCRGEGVGKIHGKITGVLMDIWVKWIV